MATYVQLNTGCTPEGWAAICTTGFPFARTLESDAGGLQPFAWGVAVANASLGVFGLLLLFKLALPRDWLTWAQHVIAASLISFFSWFNPWRLTLIQTGVDGGIVNSKVAAAGFPFLYRSDNRSADSLAIFTLNFLVATVCLYLFQKVSERMILPRSYPDESSEANPIRRWFITISLMLFYAWLNAQTSYTGHGYADGFPFYFRSFLDQRLEPFRPWALILDILIGIAIAFLPIALRDVPTRRANVMAFATAYVFANFHSWRLIHRFLGVGNGLGFPLPFAHEGENQIPLVAVNVLIGLLLSFLVYRISPSESADA